MCLLVTSEVSSQCVYCTIQTEIVSDWGIRARPWRGDSRAPGGGQIDKLLCAHGHAHTRTGTHTRARACVCIFYKVIFIFWVQATAKVSSVRLERAPKLQSGWFPRGGYSAVLQSLGEKLHNISVTQNCLLFVFICRQFLLCFGFDAIPWWG